MLSAHQAQSGPRKMQSWHVSIDGSWQNCVSPLTKLNAPQKEAKVRLSRIFLAFFSLFFSYFFIIFGAKYLSPSQLPSE